MQLKGGNLTRNKQKIELNKSEYHTIQALMSAREEYPTFAV